MMTARAVLLTKDDPWGERATKLAEKRLSQVNTITGGLNDVERALADNTIGADGDKPWLISFIYGTPIPARLIERSYRAINFHPGSHDYPGTGCYNFALYEQSPRYGCVCHDMVPRVDSGPIIAERLFPARTDETILSLRERTLEEMLVMFDDILCEIGSGRALPRSDVSWTRRAFTRAELDELCRITIDMTADEVHRRVRATRYPNHPGAYIELHGIRFADLAPGQPS